MQYTYLVKLRDTAGADTVKASTSTVSPETGCLFFYDKYSNLTKMYNKLDWISCERIKNDY